MQFLVSKIMKKITRSMAFSLALSILTVAPVRAYEIGGAYAQLVSCTWGQHGYEFGHIGTYNANGKMYSVFFGSKWCES